MWPVTRFLYELTGANDRRELAGILLGRLGSVDRDRALRRIYALIDEGSFDHAFAAELEGAFPERVAGLREALAATESQQAAREEAQASEAQRAGNDRFRPHLWVATQRDRTTQLTILAVTGGIERWLKVWLADGIGREIWREQQKQVYRAVREHHRRGGASVAIPFLGRVVGYWYRPRLESRYWVSLDGILHNVDHGPFEEPRARPRSEPPSLVS